MINLRCILVWVVARWHVGPVVSVLAKISIDGALEFGNVGSSTWWDMRRGATLRGALLSPHGRFWLAGGWHSCKCCLRVRAISESWNDKLSGNIELAWAEDKWWNLGNWKSSQLGDLFLISKWYGQWETTNSHSLVADGGENSLAIRRSSKS